MKGYPKAFELTQQKRQRKRHSWRKRRVAIMLRRYRPFSSMVAFIVLILCASFHRVQSSYSTASQGEALDTLVLSRDRLKDYYYHHSEMDNRASPIDQIVRLVDTTAGLLVTKFVQDILQEKVWSLPLLVSTTTHAAGNVKHDESSLVRQQHHDEKAGSMRTIVIDGSDLDAYVAVSSSVSSLSTKSNIDEWWKDHVMDDYDKSSNGQSDYPLVVDFDKLELLIQHEVMDFVSGSRMTSRERHRHHYDSNTVGLLELSPIPASRPHHPSAASLHHNSMFRVQLTQEAKNKLSRLAHAESIQSLELLLSEGQYGVGLGHHRNLEASLTGFGFLVGLIELAGMLFGMFGLTWFTAFLPLCLPLVEGGGTSSSFNFDLCADLFFEIVDYVLSIYLQSIGNSTTDDTDDAFFWGWMPPIAPPDFEPQVMVKQREVDYVAQTMGMFVVDDGQGANTSLRGSETRRRTSTKGSSQEVDVPLEAARMVAYITEKIQLDLYKSIVQEGYPWDEAVSQNAVISAIQTSQRIR